MTDFHLRLTNSGENTIDFIVEPWGDVFPMAPAATFEIAFQMVGEKGNDAPEVQWSADAITVYAGRNSTFSIVESPATMTNGAHKLETRELTSI